MLGIFIIFVANSSLLKSSLAAMEGEAGGQTKGEILQLQKSLRDITTESKFKDAEIQKLKDVKLRQYKANH